MPESSIEKEHPLGSVNDYADKNGLDPKSPDTFREYTQSLIEHNVGNTALKSRTIGGRRETPTSPPPT